MMNIKALKAFSAAFAFLMALSSSAQNSPYLTDCEDGDYRGKTSNRREYYKDPYTWAVNRDFAKRFCMPEEFIADDLIGAEAIAYKYQKSSLEACKIIGDHEVCGQYSYSHQIEIYVRKDANIPKYDAEVMYYKHSNSSSKDLLGAQRKDKLIAKLNQQAELLRQEKFVMPPGERNPYRGYTPSSRGKQTGFHYLALLDYNKADQRAAALRLDYYKEDIYEGINLIVLNGWAVGNLADPKLPKATRGYAIAVWTGDGDLAHGPTRYPDDVLHTIHLPRRITDVMHSADQRSGRAF